MNLKILYVATLSNTINAFLIPHIKMLVDEGHEVDIACNIDQKIDTKLKSIVGNIFKVNFNRSPFKLDNIKAYKEIIEIINQEKYEIIHTHTPTASAIVRLACRNLSNTKVIYTAHGFHFYKGAPLKDWLIFYPIEKWLSKYTDCLITINNEDYNTALNMKFKAKAIKKIHGVGIDLSKFYPINEQEKIKLRKKHKFKKNDFILIYPAELNKNKNQSLLIRTIDILKDKIPTVKLILAGNGDLLDYYKKMAYKKGLNKHIIFTGFRKDIDELLKLSDISVASSIREGLPVNIMEGMACGLPIVATRNRGHNELVKHNKNGYLVNLNKPKEFADSIFKLYKNQQRRKEMGKVSFILVNRYSIENVCRELEAIYRNYISI